MLDSQCRLAIDQKDLHVTMSSLARDLYRYVSDSDSFVVTASHYGRRKLIIGNISSSRIMMKTIKMLLLPLIIVIQLGTYILLSIINVK